MKKAHTSSANARSFHEAKWLLIGQNKQRKMADVQESIRSNQFYHPINKCSKTLCSGNSRLLWTPSIETTITSAINLLSLVRFWVVLMMLLLLPQIHVFWDVHCIIRWVVPSVLKECSVFLVQGQAVQEEWSVFFWTA
jgi:hypothetical protein